MKRFTLLVNGEDIDTGHYEYFPYADQMILDYRKVRETMVNLRKGIDVKDADKYIFARYCVSNREDYSKIIDYAYNAFLEFKKVPLSTRKKLCCDIYKNLLKYKEDFISILIAEGHPRILAEWEFEGMRVGSSPETIDFYFSQIRKEAGRRASEIVYLSRRPDGVICVCPPGNAAASNSYNAILAFITGNTIIMKPPLRTPLSTIFLWKEIVGKAVKENHMPDGTVNIVLGNSQQLMDTWLSSEKISDIIFFGDSKKGIEMGSKIYAAGKKPILELSGNDMVLVWKDADSDGATDSLLDCFLGSTQICMVPKIAVVHEGIFDKVAKKLSSKVASLKYGLPTDPETILTPVAKINEFKEFLADALEKGARILCGGERVDHTGAVNEKGMYIQPTIIEVDDIEVAQTMRFMKEEIFFPLLPIIKVTGDDKKIFESMINHVQIHQYGLRVSLWISSSTYFRRFVKNLDNCGLLRINMRHVGFSYYLSTHGGTRKSGGPFGEMNYFWKKTSHLQGIARRV